MSMVTVMGKRLEECFFSKAMLICEITFVTQDCRSLVQHTETLHEVKHFFIYNDTDVCLSQMFSKRLVSFSVWIDRTRWARNTWAMAAIFVLTMAVIADMVRLQDTHVFSHSEGNFITQRSNTL